MKLQMGYRMILLTTEDAAEKMWVKIQTLAGWRHRRFGPKYIKRGQTILYQLDHIEEWLARQVIDPSSWPAVR